MLNKFVPVALFASLYLILVANISPASADVMTEPTNFTVYVDAAGTEACEFTVANQHSVHANTTVTVHDGQTWEQFATLLEVEAERDLETSAIVPVPAHGELIVRVIPNTGGISSLDMHDFRCVPEPVIFAEPLVMPAPPETVEPVETEVDEPSEQGTDVPNETEDRSDIENHVPPHPEPQPELHPPAPSNTPKNEIKPPVEQPSTLTRPVKQPIETREPAEHTVQPLQNSGTNELAHTGPGATTTLGAVGLAVSAVGFVLVAWARRSRLRLAA